MLCKGFYRGVAQQLAQRYIVDRAMEYLAQRQNPDVRSLNPLGNRMRAEANAEIMGDQLAHQVGQAGFANHIWGYVSPLEECGDLFIKGGGTGGHNDGLIPKILDGEDILFRQRILRGDQSDVIILLNLLIIELLAVSRQLVLLIDDKCSVKGAV